MKKTKSGISLIVLVITVLVIAILAATVIITISNTNVISQTSQATFKSDMSSYKEAYELYITSRLADDSSFDRSSLSLTYSEDADTYSEIFGEVPEKYQAGLQIQDGKLVYETEDETEKTIVKDLGMEAPTHISKEKNGDTSPYLGCYVEIDGEYGIIFADLVYGGSGSWEIDANPYTYSYDAVTDTTTVKDYIESGTYTDSIFGTNDVLEVAGDTTGKQDRFYVMALSDINTGTLYCWYDAARDKGIDNSNSQVTSIKFGTGKANTATMIAKWNLGEVANGGYGAQNDNSSYKDMWGVIQDKVAKGWFVPSEDEWSAFVVYLKGRSPALDTSNYSSTYELADYYWSSSLDVGHAAWSPNFSAEWMAFGVLSDACYVRLVATF